MSINKIYKLSLYLLPAIFFLVGIVFFAFDSQAATGICQCDYRNNKGITEEKDKFNDKFTYTECNDRNNQYEDNNWLDCTWITTQKSFYCSNVAQSFSDPNTGNCKSVQAFGAKLVDCSKYGSSDSPKSGNCPTRNHCIDEGICYEISHHVCKDGTVAISGPCTEKKQFYCKCSVGSNYTCVDNGYSNVCKSGCVVKSASGKISDKDCPKYTGATKASTDYFKKAQSDATQLNPANFSSPTDVLAIGLKLSLGSIGLVTLALYVWAGFLWGTSNGNSEKTGRAAQIIMWTTIGLFTMLISYRAIKYIFDAVIK